MDFLSDQLYNGTCIRILAVIDVFSRSCLALRAGRHFRGDEVTATLASLKKRHGTPQSIRVDNGTEFSSKVVDQWAYWNKVELDFSRPGRPTDNAFIDPPMDALGLNALTSIGFCRLMMPRINLIDGVWTITGTGPIPPWGMSPRRSFWQPLEALAPLRYARASKGKSTEFFSFSLG